MWVNGRTTFKSYCLLLERNEERNKKKTCDEWKNDETEKEWIEKKWNEMKENWNYKWMNADEYYNEHWTWALFIRAQKKIDWIFGAMKLSHSTIGVCARLKWKYAIYTNTYD